MIGLDFGFGTLEAEFWRLMFVMTRIGAAVFAAPLFGSASVPAQVRVMLAGAIGVLVCAWSNIAAPQDLLSAAGMASVAGEVLVGLAMGFVLQLAFAAPVLAAEVIGGTMGMSMATSADPNSGTQSPALGQYFTVVMTLVFLAIGAHLTWIGLLVDSYAAFPPGDTWLGPERLAIIAPFGGKTFAAALAIALPVSLVLFVTQLVTGVLSRSAPALNLFALGLPAGVLAGICALILSAPVLAEQAGELSGDAVAMAAEMLVR